MSSTPNRPASDRRTTGDRPVSAPHPRHWDHPAYVLFIVLVSVILADAAIMLVLATVLPLSGPVIALVNAALLALVLLPLLLIFVYRPFKAHLEERDQAVHSFRESEQRFRDIAENANEWIWEVDAEGRYTYASPVVEKVLGYTPEEMLDKYFYDLFQDEDREALKQEALKTFAAKRPFHNYINRNIHKSGKSVWLATSGIPIFNEDGSLAGYRGADTVKHDESAITDGLTRVLNRQGFYLLAEQQLRMAVRNEMRVALLFADMDGLKGINDRFGHMEGDQALVDVAEIIRSAVRESDIVARFGGDEFVVLLTGTTKADVEQVVLHSIRDKVSRFNTTSGRKYTLSISAGVVPYDPAQPRTLDELILNADRLMYERKRLKH